VQHCSQGRGLRTTPTARANKSARCTVSSTKSGRVNKARDGCGAPPCSSACALVSTCSCRRKYHDQAVCRLAWLQMQCHAAVQQGAFNTPPTLLATALLQRVCRPARPHWQHRLQHRPIECWGCCRASGRMSATAALTPGLHGNLLQLVQACSRRLGRQASVWRAGGWQRLTATGGSAPAAPPRAQPTASMLPRPSIPNPAPCWVR
jgi:hypothetical protein